MPKGIPIRLYHATAAGALPPAGSLTEGELALDALSQPARLWTQVPVTRDPSGRIDLLSDGAPTLPLSIVNGGTGATTGAGALDNLSGTSGATAGWLNRDTAGQWLMTNPGNIFAPINNPTFTGTVNTPALTLNGTALTLPLSIANGGTGATTAEGAFDNLTGASGSTAGWVSRNAAGAWSVMSAANLATALAGNWLPINNPAFSGTLTGPNVTLTGGVTVGGNATANLETVPLQQLQQWNNAAGTTAPTPATAGRLWYDSTSGQGLKFYTGTAWSLVGTGLWLPVNNPSYTGILTALTPNMSGTLYFNVNATQYADVAWGSGPAGPFAFLWGGPGDAPNNYELDLRQGAAYFSPTQDRLTRVGTTMISQVGGNILFYARTGTIGDIYVRAPIAFISENGLWTPTPHNGSYGCWVGEGSLGCWDGSVADTFCNVTMQNSSPWGLATVRAMNDAGRTVAMSCNGTQTGLPNAAALWSDAPGGLWIQSWVASPAGGIHFAIGNKEEVREFLSIEEDGVHFGEEEPLQLSSTWHDDNEAVTLANTDQKGLDIPAGGEVMLGAGAGLLMLTTTSAPHSTALFLLGNQFARLITDTSGDGWTDGYPPPLQGKLLVFCRDGKYYVGNGRAETVHLNDMMFKNAED